MKVPPGITATVQHVFPTGQNEIVDFDMRGIHVKNDGKEYYIRLWNIDDEEVRWSLFEGENELRGGTFKYK